jgi:hypothetical protein
LESEAWLPDAGVFVASRPLTEIWATPGLRWRDALAAKIAGPLRHPYLTFTRKDRSWYDLDNLVYPVVAVSGCGACESIWARVERGSEEGVLIQEQPPPGPPVAADVLSIHLARPSDSSVTDRPPPPELAGVGTFGTDEPLGLALEFDNDDVPVGELSFDGPVKSLIDDLTPVFGQRLISGRLLAKDYRVRELRITRGHAPRRGGVTASVWFL